MAQKLILRVEENKIQLQDFAAFVVRCGDLKLGPRTEIGVEMDNTDFYFAVDIPEPVVKIRRLTKTQVAVEKQISDRKEAVANGEEVPGHVAALVKTPVAKGLCFQCNKQQKLTRAGVFAKHTINGKACEGSGSTPIVISHNTAGAKAVAKITAKRQAAAEKAEDAAKHKDEGFSSSRKAFVSSMTPETHDALMEAQQEKRAKAVVEAVTKNTVKIRRNRRAK